MILSACLVDIVGKLMVVPNGNEWMRFANCSQANIQSILCVTRSIILQRNNFVRWQVKPTDRCITVFSCSVFVNVIAQVQDRIELFFSDTTVGIEVPKLPIAAAHHSK